LKPVDLALNRALGITEAPVGAAHLLEMPATPLVQNHLGTVHAAAQFALAEAASAECLHRQFAAGIGTVVPDVRRAEVKYRAAARETLFAFAELDAETRAGFLADLTARGRAVAQVQVLLKNAGGAVSFSGTFEWFVARADAPAFP
jgi:acyl-coenzyme A thioesterase PaaI-like protein